jgi:hypothetical protein
LKDPHVPRRPPIAVPLEHDAISLIRPTSLSQTVDAINAVLFAGGSVSGTQRDAVVRWMVARQGLPRAYAGTFAGFPSELTHGISTFTGERITSASARHILGEETCRVLRLIAAADRVAAPALERANHALQNRIDAAAADPRNENPGLYCCGKCSVGFWRNLLSGGLDRQEERLYRGVGELRASRDDDGGWRRFPFWYTVLALSEMDFGLATNELAYAGPRLERTAERATSSPYGLRRKTLAARALDRI